MSLFAFLYRRSRFALALILATGLVGGLSDAGFAAIISAAVRGGDHSRDYFALAFALLCVASVAAGLSSRVLFSVVLRRTYRDLILDLSSNILESDLQSLESSGQPAILTAFTDDLNAISDGILAVPHVCLSGVFVAGCLAYIGFLLPAALVIILVIFAFGALTLFLAQSRARRCFDAARRGMDELHEHVRSLVYGTKELKMHRERRHEFLSSTLRDAVESWSRQNFTANIIYTLFGGWTQFLFSAALFVLVLPLPHALRTSSATVATYTMVLIFMLGGVANFTGRLPVLARSSTAIRNLNRLTISLKSRPEQREPEPRQPTAYCRSLQLREVTHSYEGQRDAFSLGPLSLTLHPGETVFITGGNGSGKTTLAKLLVGLYRPSSGEIYLNGRSITDDERPLYRELFSVVFADSYAFKTLLGLERPGIDDEANQYLQAYDLSDAVRVKDRVFSTLQLSQGQRKRIALITAYLEDRPAFVFDEWAAEQDPAFKELFYHKLLPGLRARKKMVIVITHDDRYFSSADRIVRLEAGRITVDSQAVVQGRQPASVG